MKVRMLAYLQNDGSVQLIPVEDAPSVVKTIVTNAMVGTNLKFTVIETERSKLEKAPRVGSAYHVSRRGVSNGGFLTGDDLLDLVLLMEILDDGGYDYDSRWDETPIETEPVIDTPVMESCGTTEPDTTDDFKSSPSYESSSSYSDSSSYDSGSSDCGGGSDD